MLKKLQNAVDSCVSLEELVNVFFDVVDGVKGEVEYVAGEMPAVYMQPGCKFLLQYSRELEDGEFYQLNMDVELDTDGEEYPYDHKIYDENDGDLREYILNSEVYGMLEDKEVLNVSVYENET